MSYPNWLLWLAGTLPPLALLWGLWQLALRPERCYRYNRALLLLAPAVAAALPLLPRPALPAWLAVGTPASPVVAVMLPTLPIGATAPHAAAVVAGWPWLLTLYLAGVALGLGRLAWQVLRLRHLARQLPGLEYDDYTLVRTGGRLPTSTFGRVVFWDETTALAPAEVAAVLAHELAHVRQRHTRDVLWGQAWRIVLWPNPFAHLLLPALRLTHELLADAEAAAETSAQPYAPLLARLAARQLAGRPAGFSLLQPFAFSATLTRIAMLKNQLPVRRWKQWLVLPVLGGLWLAASQTATAQTVPAAPAPPIPVGPADQQVVIHRLTRAAMHRDSLRGPISPDSTLYVMIRYPTGSEAPAVQVRRVKKGEMVQPDGSVSLVPKPTSDAAGVYTYVDQYPRLLGSDGTITAIMKSIQERLVYPAGPTGGGRVFVRFVVNSDGSLGDLFIVKGLTDEAYDRAVLAAIRKLPRFEPGRQDGRAVAVSLTVPVLFAPKP